MACAGAYLQYRDGIGNADALAKIGDVDRKLSSLISRKSQLESDTVTLSTRIDSLLKERDTIVNSIRTLSDIQMKIRSATDSISKLQNAQLEGKLVPIWGESQMVEGGLYTRTDKLRSSWLQDIRDIRIKLRYNSTFRRVKVVQRFPSNLMIWTCPNVDTSIIADLIEYSCGYLRTGEWIEVTAYSDSPLSIVEHELSP